MLLDFEEFPLHFLHGPEHPKTIRNPCVRSGRHRLQALSCRLNISRFMNLFTFSDLFGALRYFHLLTFTNPCIPFIILHIQTL